MSWRGLGAETVYPLPSCSLERVCTSLLVMHRGKASQSPETSLGIYWDEHELAQTSKFVLVVRNRSWSYTERSKAATVGSENVGLDRPFLLASPLDQVTDLWRGRVARLGKIIVPTSRVIVRNKTNLSATVREELVQSLGHAKCSV